MPTTDDKKKRGRRQKLHEATETVDPPINIQYVIEEDIVMQDKSNNQPVEQEQLVEQAQEQDNTITVEEMDIDRLTEIQSGISLEEPLSKKRGRKPKGGKIITKTAENNIKPQQIANVILHLKCSLNDLNDYNTQMNQQITNPLEYNPSIPPNIMTYNNNDTSMFSAYEMNDTNNSENVNVLDIPHNVPNIVDKPTYAYSESFNAPSANQTICSKCNNKNSETPNSDNDANVNMKDINYKLKRLKVNLYKNALPDKKSACFWCTYEFDNQACYIPKYEMDDSIFGYGSFCRPECAVAYLMKESVDDSTKFERYHLLNQIYSKVYDYKKNIKPAPDPHYLLDKFYGNLTIQEYRKLLKSEHMLLVIDKPLTRILPELHEDSEEFILNIYGNSKTGSTAMGGTSTGQTNTSGIYKVKKQSEKQQGPSKNSIMRDKFNIAQ